MRINQKSVNIVVMWIVLTRESVTAGVSGRVDKGTEKRLEMMWCQHGCHSCKEQEVYNAVTTTHCATETIDKNGNFETKTNMQRQINMKKVPNNKGSRQTRYFFATVPQVCL